MCRDNPLRCKGAKLNTTLKCGSCDIPLCKPSKGNCYNKHLKGLPKKVRAGKEKMTEYSNIQSFWYVILYPN